MIVKSQQNRIEFVNRPGSIKDIIAAEEDKPWWEQITTTNSPPKVKSPPVLRSIKDILASEEKPWWQSEETPAPVDNEQQVQLQTIEI